MPDVASYTSNTAGIPFTTASWALQARAGDGSTEATSLITVNPQANWNVIEVDTPITTIGSIFYVAGGWDLAAAVNTDQLHYYSTETVDDQNANYFHIAANGTITTNLTGGSVNGHFYDITTTTWYPFTVQIGVGTGGTKHRLLLGVG